MIIFISILALVTVMDNAHTLRIVFRLEVQVRTYSPKFFVLVLVALRINLCYVILVDQCILYLCHLSLYIHQAGLPLNVYNDPKIISVVMPFIPVFISDKVNC